MFIHAHTTTWSVTNTYQIGSGRSWGATRIDRGCESSQCQNGRQDQQNIASPRPANLDQRVRVKGADANVGLSKYAGISFEKDSALAARFLQNEHPSDTAELRVLQSDIHVRHHAQPTKPPQRTGRQQRRGGCGAVVRGLLPRDWVWHRRFLQVLPTVVPLLTPTPLQCTVNHNPVALRTMQVSRALLRHRRASSPP